MPKFIEFPDLNQTVEVPDDISDAGIDDVYKTLSRQQSRAKQGQLRAEAMEAQTKADVLDAYQNDPEMPMLMRSELGRRVAGGMANMAGSAASAASMLMPSNPEVQGWDTGLKLNAYGKELSRMGDIASTAPSSIGEIESVGDAAGYAGRMIAEQIPQLLISGPVAGGLKAAGVGAKTAAMLAPVITTFPQEAGAIYQEITDQTGEDGFRQRATAAATGLAAAALEPFGGQSRALRNLMAGGGGAFRKALGEVGREALRGVRDEALTEAGQEGIASVAPWVAGGKLPTEAEFTRRVSEAAIGGGITGGAMGGVSKGVASVGDPGVYAAALKDAVSPGENRYARRDQGGNVIRDDQDRLIVDRHGGINSDEGLQPYRGARIEEDQNPASRLNPNDVGNLAVSESIADAHKSGPTPTQPDLETQLLSRLGVDPQVVNSINAVSRTLDEIESGYEVDQSTRDSLLNQSGDISSFLGRIADTASRRNDSTGAVNAVLGIKNRLDRWSKDTTAYNELTAEAIDAARQGRTPRSESADSLIDELYSIRGERVRLADAIARGRDAAAADRKSKDTADALAVSAEQAAAEAMAEEQEARRSRREEQQAAMAERKQRRASTEEGLSSEYGQTYDIPAPPEPETPPAPARSTLDTDSGLRQARNVRSDVTSPIDAYMMGRAPRRLNLPQPIADLYSGVGSIISAVNNNEEVDPETAADLAVQAPNIASQLKVRIENAIASGISDADINPLIDLANQLDAYPANYKAYSELTQEMMTKARRTSERRRGITPTKPQKISLPTVISLPAGTGAAPVGGVPVAAPVIVSNGTQGQTSNPSPTPKVKPTETKAPGGTGDSQTTEVQGVDSANKVETQPKDDLAARVIPRINAAAETPLFQQYRTERDLASQGDEEAQARLEKLQTDNVDNPNLRDVIAAYEWVSKYEAIDKFATLKGIKNPQSIENRDVLEAQYDQAIYRWLENPAKPMNFQRLDVFNRAFIDAWKTTDRGRAIMAAKKAKQRKKARSGQVEDDISNDDLQKLVDDVASDIAKRDKKISALNKKAKGGVIRDSDPALGSSGDDVDAGRNRTSFEETDDATADEATSYRELSTLLNQKLREAFAAENLTLQSAGEEKAKSLIKSVLKSIQDLGSVKGEAKIALANINKYINEYYQVAKQQRLFASKELNGRTGRTLDIGEITLEDAINAVLDSTDPTNVVNVLAKKLLKAGVKAKVVVLSDADFDQLGAPAGEVAYYDPNPNGNTIFIRQSASSHDYLVMHEAIHAATVHALKTNVRFRNEIGRLRAMAVEALGTDYYGLQDRGNNFTNLAEFIAEGFTNPEFRAKLEAIPVKDKGIWSTIKGMFGKIFGLDTNEQTVLDALLDMTSSNFAPNVASSASPQDAAYMDLAARYEAGDESVLPELQRMVDEAAKAAGYRVGPVYHASRSNFDVFLSKADQAEQSGEEFDYDGYDGGNLGTGFYFTPERGYASRYGTPRAFYLKIKNLVDLSDPNTTRRVVVIQRELEEDRGSVDPGEVYDELVIERNADGITGKGIGGFSAGASEVLIKKSNQAKLADPITRDSNGNVIPLSQRFNPESNNILFAAKPFTSAQQVIDALKIPDAEGQAAIMDSARSTQQLLPRKIADNVRNRILPDKFRDLLTEIDEELDKKERAKLIKAAKDQGFDYGKWRKSAERRADNDLKSTLRLAELTEQEGKRISDITDPRMKREASFVVTQTAMRIEQKLQLNQQRKESLQKAANDPNDPLNVALEDLKSIEGMIATTADDAIAEYREYLRNLRTESKLSGLSVNEQVVDIATRAQRLGRQTNQIGDAIVNIASKLTEDEVKNAKTNADLVQLIRDKAIIDGSPIQNLLSPADGTPGLLLQYSGLKAALLHIQSLKKNKAQVADEIDAAQKAFADAVGKKKAGYISLSEFARAYVRLVTTLGEIASVNRKIARRTKDIRVAELLENSLTDVTSSPEYVEQRNEAVRTEDRTIYGINGRNEGNYHIVELGQDPNDPNKLEEFRFLNTVNRPADNAANAETYVKLLSKIDAMLDDPTTSPELRHTLVKKRMELEIERDDRIEGAMGLSIIDPIGYFRRLPFVKGFITANLPAWLMNGLLGKRIRGLQDTLDRLHVKIKDLSNNQNYGRRAIKLASFAATQSHAADMPSGLDQNQQVEWWVSNVLEPVLSQNQNIKEDALKVGEFTRNNVKVTKEDIKAAQMMAKWNDELRKIIEITSGISEIFPTRIVEKINGIAYSRLAYAQSSMTVPRMLNRITTPSGNSGSPMDIVNRWTLLKTKEEKLAFLADHEAFDMLALSHVAELNSEYKRFSENEQVYRKLARKWRKDGSAPTSFNELLDQIDSEVSPEGDVEDDIDAMFAEDEGPTTADKLIKEIDDYTKKLINQAKVTEKENAARLSSQVGTSKRSELSVLIELDGENAFTKPRLEMLAPSSFYRYELATDHSFGSLKRGALMPLQLQQLELFGEYESKLKAAIIEIEQERDKKSWNDFTKDMVRSAKGDIYMTSGEMKRMLKQLEIVRSALEDALNVRPTSSESPGFASKMMEFIKSQLLGSLPTLVRNLFTGYGASRTTADMLLRGHQPLGPGRALTTHLVGTLRDIAAALFEKSPGVDRLLRSVNSGPLRPIFQSLITSSRQIMAARSHLGNDGYTLKQDLAARALGDNTFSSNQFGEGLGSQLADKILSAPGIRHYQAFINKVIDRQERLTNLLSIKYFDEALREYFNNLSQIIEQRIADGKAGTLDFSKPENRFTAKELASVKINPNTWARQLRVFNTTKTIEQMAFDYYQRVQKAKADGQNWTMVAFTEDDGIYGDMIEALGRLNNQPALSNRPTITRARTQYGDFARQVVLFPGYANGYLSTQQLMQTIAKASDIPDRMKYTLGQSILLFLVLVALGIPTAELSKWMYRVFYGRPYPVETFSDLAYGKDITAARVGRVLGGAIATTIPYLGEYIASAMGAQNYKAAVTDLANISLPLKLATALYDTAKSYVQTGDATGAALSVARNITPGTMPLINRLPAIQNRNAAADAVRVAKVNRGELEVPERGGGGFGGQQTEFGSTINKALAASASGDMESAQQYIAKATKLKADAGDKNPQASVRNAIQSRRPEYKAFGRRLSDDEKSGLLSRMSDGQRKIYDKADNAASQLLKLTPTKTQMSQGSGSAIDRINKRISKLRKSTKPKALTAINKRIKSLKPKKLKIGKASAATGTRLLRPRARAKGVSGRLPSAL
jgi:hypothetical protein